MIITKLPCPCRYCNKRSQVCHCGCFEYEEWKEKRAIEIDKVRVEKCCDLIQSTRFYKKYAKVL